MQYNFKFIVRRFKEKDAYLNWVLNPELLLYFQASYPMEIPAKREIKIRINLLHDPLYTCKRKLLPPFPTQANSILTLGLTKYFVS